MIDREVLCKLKKGTIVKYVRVKGGIKNTQYYCLCDGKGFLFIEVPSGWHQPYLEFDYAIGYYQDLEFISSKKEKEEAIAHVKEHSSKARNILEPPKPKKIEPTNIKDMEYLKFATGKWISEVKFTPQRVRRA